MNSECTAAATPTRPAVLSSWENEGGAPAEAPQAGERSAGQPADMPLLSNAELVQLRVRVIALENVIIGLLSSGSEEQLRLVCELATYISPRPGFTSACLDDTRLKRNASIGGSGDPFPRAGQAVARTRAWPKSGQWVPEPIEATQSMKARRRALGWRVGGYTT